MNMFFQLLRMYFFGGFEIHNAPCTRMPVYTGTGGRLRNIPTGKIEIVESASE
jgi:hypothetical protein